MKTNMWGSSVPAEGIPFSVDYPTAEELASKKQGTVLLVNNDAIFPDDEYLVCSGEGMELNINMSQLKRANSKLMFTSLDFGMRELSNVVTMRGGSPLRPVRSEDYNLSFIHPTAPNGNTSPQATVLATDSDRAEAAPPLATTPYDLSTNETTSVEHEPLTLAHPSTEVMTAGGVSTELGVSTDNDCWSSGVSAESIPYPESGNVTKDLLYKMLQDEKDKKQIASTGLVFRMEVKQVHCILCNGVFNHYVVHCFTKCSH